MVTKGEYRFLDSKLLIIIADDGNYSNGQNSADQIACSDPKCEGIREGKGWRCHAPFQIRLGITGWVQVDLWNNRQDVEPLTAPERNCHRNETFGRTLRIETSSIIHPLHWTVLYNQYCEKYGDLASVADILLCLCHFNDRARIGCYRVSSFCGECIARWNDCGKTHETRTHGSRKKYGLIRNQFCIPTIYGELPSCLGFGSRPGPRSANLKQRKQRTIKQAMGQSNKETKRQGLCHLLYTQLPESPGLARVIEE